MGDNIDCVSYGIVRRDFAVAAGEEVVTKLIMWSLAGAAGSVDEGGWDSW